MSTVVIYFFHCQYSQCSPKAQCGCLRGPGKASLPRGWAAWSLLYWWLAVRAQPQQTKGCVEEVDGRRAVCDESGFQAQGLKKLHLQGWRIKPARRHLQGRPFTSAASSGQPALNQVVSEVPPSPSSYRLDFLQGIAVSSATVPLAVPALKGLSRGAL